MIDIVDFDAILARGIECFSTTDTIDKIEDSFGKPDSIELYHETHLFYHYDNIKFDIRDSKLERVVIYFLNFEKEYKISVFDGEMITLDKDSSIGQIIQSLNANLIKWVVKYEESMHDYFVIDLESGVRMFFYLYTDQLERVSLNRKSLSQ